MKELFIMDALTDLLASEDTAVVNAACLGLLDLVELRAPEVADYITTSRRFATTLVCLLLALSLEQCIYFGMCGACSLSSALHLLAYKPCIYIGTCAACSLISLAYTLTCVLLSPCIAEQRTTTYSSIVVLRTTALHVWRNINRIRVLLCARTMSCCLSEIKV